LMVFGLLHLTLLPLEKLYSVMILFISGLSLALERLEMTYFHETFGNRNKIKRLFRELKNRTKRFHNNVNSKTLKSIEEIYCIKSPFQPCQVNNNAVMTKDE